MDIDTPMHAAEIVEHDGLKYTVRTGPFDNRHKEARCDSCGNTGGEWEAYGCPKNKNQCMFTFKD